MALDIISSINLDMKAPNAEVVYGNQYDSAGYIRAQLLNDGEKWEVPSGAKAIVSYRKSDRIGGYYDTTEFGETAVAISSDRSIVTIALDAQTLTTYGPVYVQINFVQNNQRLSTFEFMLQVKKSPIVQSNIESKWFVHLLGISGIVVDDTLSISGHAADAKVTGDRFTEVENEFTEVDNEFLRVIELINSETGRATNAENLKVDKPIDSPNGRNGQLLRSLGNGRTEWTDQGLPSDEQTAEAVSAWLDEHPEATTTVQDGEITIKKLSDDIAPRYIIFPTVNPQRNPPGQCMAVTYMNRAFLVDIGRSNAFDEIKDQLQNYGIDTIDSILITHYHGDHDGNPTSGATYRYLSDAFNMDDCIFYLPLDPPTIVPSDDKNTNIESKLQEVFPNNTFLKPPYGEIKWHGYTITTCNCLQEDYDYLVENNETDYNCYATITRIEHAGVSVLNMADARKIAQTRQLDLGNIKPSTIITDPHHGLETDGDIRLIKLVHPQYMFINDAYVANSICYRSPLIAEASRRGCTIITNTDSYPNTVAGNFNKFVSLSGGINKYAPYSAESLNVVYVSANVGANEYQDGTLEHPYSNTRRGVTEAKDYTEIRLLTDVDDYVNFTAANGDVTIDGNGHYIYYINSNRGASITLKNIEVGTLYITDGTYIRLRGNTRITTTARIEDSILSAEDTVTFDVPIQSIRSIAILGITNQSQGHAYIGNNFINQQNLPQLFTQYFDRDSNNGPLVNSEVCSNGGNVYGSIKDGIMYMQGWIGPSDNIVPGNVALTRMPPPRVDTLLFFVDGNTGTIGTLYIPAGGTEALFMTGCEAYRSHSLTFMAIYPLQQIYKPT